MFSGLQGDTSYVSCAKLHRFLVSLRVFTLIMSEIAKFWVLKPSEIANFPALDVAGAQGVPPFPVVIIFCLNFLFSDYHQNSFSSLNLLSLPKPETDETTAGRGGQSQVQRCSTTIIVFSLRWLKYSLYVCGVELWIPFPAHAHDNLSLAEQCGAQRALSALPAYVAARNLARPVCFLRCRLFLESTTGTTEDNFLCCLGCLSCRF